MPRTSSRRIFVIFIQWGFALTLGLALAACTLYAQEPPRNYTFLLASGFLCDSDHAEACPAVAKDANGSSFEMSGAGTFSPHDKSVTAAGTFARKSPSGTVLETGVWLAASLVSFDSYGLAPGALKAGNPAMRDIHAGARMRTRMLVGPTAAGGLAVFRIRLFPIAGAPQNALLAANCALGNVPRERSVEGIRLTLERDGMEFSEEAGGRVMFLAMRPELSTPAKTLQQEPDPASVETPNN